MAETPAAAALATPADVLRLWFDELTPAQHFRKDPDLDAHLRQRFGVTLDAAARGELWHWRAGAHGRLAEIVVLDQFSRNIHRYTARAFAQDPLALALAQELVVQGLDQDLPPTWRPFAYLPYMHSESLVIHDEALRLFAQPGLEHHLDFEHRHRAILLRFGRYPHRNTALGRTSTPEELAFLQEPGSSF